MFEKIKLINYKNFTNTEVKFNTGRNILVGENGVGKSTILQAITMVLSGTTWQIDKNGIETLFNVLSTQLFMKIPRDKRTASQLPKIFVELYFNKKIDPKVLSKNPYNLKGRHNTDESYLYGIRFKAEPDIDNFSDEIYETIKNSDAFPFDYYKAVFETFDGTSYTSYTKPFRVKSSLVDTTSINTTVALKNQIFQIFESQANKVKRQKVSHEYHKIANDFSRELYGKHGLNSSNSDYRLKLKALTELSFREILTAQDKNEISIENFGDGEKVLLGVESSLTKTDEKCQIMLIEEPENHLSYLNMHRLIGMIEKTDGKQTFIATHSNMIASRLNLSNVILMSNFAKPLKLSDIGSDTANFFAKAPNTNILDFVLAKKVILVEGSAEYILMNEFYKRLIGHEPHEDGVSVISCGGKTFERYLEIAQPLQKVVAVITDNDGNTEKNITKKYQSYTNNQDVKVRADLSESNRTFEVSLFNENQEFFAKNKFTKSKSVLDYMLNNKAEAAFRLLNLLQDETVGQEFKIPEYIKDVIKWITTK